MKNYIIWMVALVMAGMSFRAVAPTQWKIAKGYSVKFDGGGDVSGIFKEMSGTIVFNEASLGESKVVLKVKVASINTGNGMMNNHAKGKDWFDAAKYPEIKFTSSSFHKKEKGFEVKGTLEIKDVKKEISIPFSFSKQGKGGEFKASFTIDRNDYHVGSKGASVQSDIKLSFTIPVTK